MRLCCRVFEEFDSDGLAARRVTKYVAFPPAPRAVVQGLPGERPAPARTNVLRGSTIAV